MMLSSLCLGRRTSWKYYLNPDREITETEPEYD